MGPGIESGKLKANIGAESLQARNVIEDEITALQKEYDKTAQRIRSHVGVLLSKCPPLAGTIIIDQISSDEEVTLIYFDPSQNSISRELTSQDAEGLHTKIEADASIDWITYSLNICLDVADLASRKHPHLTPIK